MKKSIIKLNKSISLSIFVIILFSFMLFPQVVYAEGGIITSKEELQEYVATCVANHQEEITVTYNGEDWENMKEWFKPYFHYDNLVTKGEYAAYNYEGAKFKYLTYSDCKVAIVTISYKETVEEHNIVMNFVRNKIDTDGIKNMSDYEAIRYVTDFLVTEYDFLTKQNKTIDILNIKQGNCHSFTMLFFFFMDELSIPCRTTLGDTKGEHIWNTVQLDGQWYYHDIIWNKKGTTNPYFLVSTATISKTHTILGHFVPDCPSDYVVKDSVESGESSGSAVAPKPAPENTVKKKRVFETVDRLWSKNRIQEKSYR